MAKSKGNGQERGPITIESCIHEQASVLISILLPWFSIAFVYGLVGKTDQGIFLCIIRMEHEIGCIVSRDMRIMPMA